MTVQHTCVPAARICGNLLVIAALTVAGNAYAATDDCTAIRDSSARLACYDRLHGRAEAPSAGREPRPMDEAATPAPPPAPAPPSPPEGVATKSAPAAAGGAAAPQSAPPRRAQDDEHITEVSAVGKTPTGRSWFRLADGELWEQVTPRRTDIAAGDQVRVSKSGIGTYHLRRADGGSRSTQVRRLE